MTNTPAHSPQDRTRQAHQLAVLVYLLYLLGILFGITALIGIIINHTRLAKTRDTYAYSHFIWQILSFWILFIGVALAVILWPGALSKILVYASLFWWIASALTGIWYLRTQKPIPFIKVTPAKTALKNTRSD